MIVLLGVCGGRLCLWVFSAVSMALMPSSWGIEV